MTCAELKAIFRGVHDARRLAQNWPEIEQLQRAVLLLAEFEALAKDRERAKP